MLQLPPMPGWESLHPLVIHFPIVLLIVSPALLLASAVLPPRNAKPYLIVALALLLAGTGAIFVAAETGEAAAELADRTPAINSAIETHQKLAAQARILFSIFSTALAALLAFQLIWRRRVTRIQTTALPLVFLALYSIGIVALVKTAHHGGILVHKYGVHAMMPADGNASADSPGEHPD